MSRVVGYVRVSTTDRQETRLQVDALNAAGATEIVEDRASGAKTDRAGLMAAIEGLQPDDTLAVWRLDRLGRSLKHLITTIEEIEAKGSHFRSITEAIDTGTPGGRMLFHMIGAMAEFERSITRDRVKAGMLAAKRAGRHLGRAPSLTAADADTIRQLLESGKSWNELARTFRTSKTTISRALKRHPPEWDAGVVGEGGREEK